MLQLPPFWHSDNGHGSESAKTARDGDLVTVNGTNATDGNKSNPGFAVTFVGGWDVIPFTIPRPVMVTSLVTEAEGVAGLPSVTDVAVTVITGNKITVVTKLPPCGRITATLFKGARGKVKDRGPFGVVSGATLTAPSAASSRLTSTGTAIGNGPEVTFTDGATIGKNVTIEVVPDFIALGSVIVAVLITGVVVGVFVVGVTVLEKVVTVVVTVVVGVDVVVLGNVTTGKRAGISQRHPVNCAGQSQVKLAMASWHVPPLRQWTPGMAQLSIWNSQ